MLIYGDNVDVMKSLLSDKKIKGQINLIYIDPPFNTGRILKKGNEIIFNDRTELNEYIEFLKQRLILMKELLPDNGSIYVHLDYHASHYVKVMMDEIFGHKNFQREISISTGWALGFKTSVNNWIRQHDVILFYSKNHSDFIFNKQYKS